jgi:transposase InsO family protein
MKEWLTARDIAAEKLPTMPSTESGVIRQAEREKWDDHPYARQRAGRGGGMEYRYLILPTAAQIAYVQKHKVFGLVATATADVANDDVELTPRAKLEQAARLSILAHFDEFWRGMQSSSRSKDTALHLFAIKYNNHSLRVDDDVRNVVKHLSKRTLARWLSAKKCGRSSKLGVDRSKARAGTGVLDNANDGKVRIHILGLIAHQPHLSGAQVLVQCRAEFGDTLNVVSKGVKSTIAMPPLRTFQHFLKGLKVTHKHELLKLTNPDRYRSTMLPSGTGMLRHITLPNELWQIDASPVDALCVDGRHAVYVCVDIATRQFITYVSKTPRASAVGMLLRKAILAWGTPKKIKTDNGSDFTAQDTKRLFMALGVEPDLSDAYSPAQKGHVERAIGTWQHQFASLLPGYVGHSVSDRKAIEDRKSFAERLGQDTAEAFGVTLSGADLQALSDEWCLNFYSHQPHAGLNGQTPFNAASTANEIRRVISERALDVLLMPAPGNGNGTRKVTKFGIRIDHFDYSAGHLMAGLDVFVRLDPTDKGRIHVFSLDQSDYLGEAICPELAGIHPETFQRARKEEHAALVKERIDPIKKEIAKIVKGPSLIRRALDVAARDLPNVVALPKREERHITPEIAAAEMVNRPEVTTRQMSKALDAISAEIVADLDPIRRETAPTRGNVQQLRTQSTKAQLFRRALEITDRIETKAAVSDDELRWLVSYQSTSDYRAMKMIHDDFGDQAPALRT